MKNWKNKFIEFILNKRILIFGDFILKSNRKSPYFFNMSLFSTGEDLKKIGKFYAQTLVNLNIEFDVLFGIAYKGIPILISTILALKNDFNINKPYSFNRKEIKTYGEKGETVGHKIQGKIVLIDDIITAGTAIKNAINIINKNKDSKISNILVAIDRKESGTTKLSAKKEIEKKYLCQISSIIDINDIILYLKNKNIMKKQLKILIQHQEKNFL
ncbi:orotate phosphoribosyltransferase [Buchnera aphidicola]|uniref:orotate phosphoribosyltransferase n=1 Tax=Buchnera aphidicola TaxID=9 RepID=UPI002238432C|nr:orotate phosphoribosyltransferase [Buchnera aphidicola]MCW5197453.1 orotate phosphoribosyltransferase [Buchnera aphidicola (Chaitophorus viminalis)]